MLLLIFKIKNEWYAIDSSGVVEVAPYLLTEKIPGSPAYVAGKINFRGAGVPVIDLRSMLEGEPCHKQISTRIILINFPAGKNISKIIGLLAENVTETVHTLSEWQPESAKLPNEPIFIKKSITKHDEDLRWFVPEQILPDNIDQLLFPDPDKPVGLPDQ